MKITARQPVLLFVGQLYFLQIFEGYARTTRVEIFCHKTAILLRFVTNFGPKYKIFLKFDCMKTNRLLPGGIFGPVRYTEPELYNAVNSSIRVGGALD